jgi:hypothetical protein
MTHYGTGSSNHYILCAVVVGCWGPGSGRGGTGVVGCGTAGTGGGKGEGCDTGAGCGTGGQVVAQEGPAGLANPLEELEEQLEESLGGGKIGGVVGGGGAKEGGFPSFTL